MLILASLATYGLIDSLFPRTTLRLPSSGQEVSLFGRGPPTMFSSGLFGLMPRRLYTRLFSDLMPRTTLVVLNDARPVTRRTFEDTADSLGVETLGFFSHSAIDGSILESPRVERAVVCDPVVVPRIPFLPPPPPPRSSALVAGSFPVRTLVVRAGQAYDPAVTTPIPEFLFPLVMTDARIETFPNVGHADLLDDAWADLGPRTIPWMRGTAVQRAPFAEWTVQRPDRAALRDDYRRQVAEMALEHLVGEEGGE